MRKEMERLMLFLLADIFCKQIDSIRLRNYGEQCTTAECKDKMNIYIKKIK